MPNTHVLSPEEIEVNLENPEPLRYILKFRVPASVVNQHWRQAITRVQKNTQIKGFRPGKAPLSFVEKELRGKIQQEAAMAMIDHFFFLELQKHRLPILGEPEFEFGWPSPNEVFEFSAEFEVYPEFQIEKWQGLEGQLLDDQVTEEDVNFYLENLAKNSSMWESVVRKPSLKDQVTVNCKAVTEEDETILNWEKRTFILEVYQDLFKGFGESLQTLDPGGQGEFTLLFPEIKGLEKYWNKPVRVWVELLSVAEARAPEVNDSWAESLGYPNLAELRDKARKHLQSYMELSSRNLLHNTLIESFVKAHVFPLPKKWVHDVSTEIIQREKKRFLDLGGTEDRWSKIEQQKLQEFQNWAEEEIRFELLLWRLAQEQSLTATEEDVRRRIEKLSQDSGLEVNQVKKFLSSSGRDLKREITLERVMEVLSREAKTKKVPIEDKATWLKRVPPPPLSAPQKSGQANQGTIS